MDEIKEFVYKYFSLMGSKISEITPSTIDVEFSSGNVERYTFDPEIFREYEDIKGLFEGSSDFYRILNNAIKNGVLGVIRVKSHNLEKNILSEIKKVISSTNYSFGESEFAGYKSTYILQQNWHIIFRNNKDGMLGNTVITTYIDIGNYSLASVIGVRYSKFEYEDISQQKINIKFSKKIYGLGTKRVMPIVNNYIKELELKLEEKVNREIELSNKHYDQIIYEIEEEIRELEEKVREQQIKIDTTQFRSQESYDREYDKLEKLKQKLNQKKKEGENKIIINKKEKERQIKRLETDYKIRAECELVNGCLIEIPILKVKQYLNKNNTKNLGSFHFKFIPSVSKIIEFPICEICQNYISSGYLCNEGHFVCIEHFVSLDKNNGLCSQCAEIKFTRCAFCQGYIKEEVYKCPSCGESFHHRHLKECNESHNLLCPFCLEMCEKCKMLFNKSLLLKCAEENCNVYFCRTHSYEQICNDCEKVFCDNDSSFCHIDNKRYCNEKIWKCKCCDKLTYTLNLKNCKICNNEYICPDCWTKCSYSNCNLEGSKKHFFYSRVQNQILCKEHKRKCIICNKIYNIDFVNECVDKIKIHFICNNCLQGHICKICNRPCCDEDSEYCYICNHKICLNHFKICINCGEKVCSNHYQKCNICGGITCRNCLTECANEECNRKGCNKHFVYSKYENKYLCNIHSDSCVECKDYFSLYNLTKCSLHSLLSNNLCCKNHKRICSNSECKNVVCESHSTITEKDGVLCNNCVVTCEECKKPFLKSKSEKCFKENIILCPDCYNIDQISKQIAKKIYFGQCEIDNKYYLKENLMNCSYCQKTISVINGKVDKIEKKFFCINHFENCNICGEDNLKWNFKICSNCGQPFCSNCTLEEKESKLRCSNCKKLIKVDKELVFKYRYMDDFRHLRDEKGIWLYAEDRKNILLIFQKASLLGLIKSGKPEIFYFPKEK